MGAMLLDEEALLAKLRKIEALHGGATTPGERDAAESAMRRIQERLRLVEKEEPAVEHKFALGDAWSRKLFLALARRYGLRPYRMSGLRHTSVMVRAPKRFVHETLWPEFVELDNALREALDQATDSVIARVFSQPAAEAELRPDGRRANGR